MPTADVLAWFDRRRRAWLAEDLATYLDCWADDLRFVSPVHPAPIVGRAAYAALVRRSAATLRPVAFDVHHLARDGDVVLAEWTIRVAVRATGREGGWDGMSRSRHRAGRIVDWREYWDPAAVRTATGA